MTLAGDEGFAPAPRGYGASLSTGAAPMSSGGSTNLGDILERVLEKGIVIAGDIRVNLLDIELLTIKLRLVVASLDTAKQVGIDWWETDPWLTGNKSELQLENERLRRRLDQLERRNGEGPALGARSEIRYAEHEDAD